MINPHVIWHEPQRLLRYPYAPDLEVIPQAPGVYIFYRCHGSKNQVFYVGKASKLRSRLKGQLNNLRLMDSIRSAANGARMLSYGEIKLKRGQRAESAIAAAERILIRHFVDEGHELFNIQGVKLRVQTLTNERPAVIKKLIPLQAQIEA